MAEEFKQQQRRQGMMQAMKDGATKMRIQRLQDNNELEERKQKELERQALEQEGASRREEFSRLNLEKKEKVRLVNEQVAMLKLSDRLIETFNNKYQITIPPAGAPPPAPEKILGIQMEIDELTSLQQQLQTRCDSDGLFVALRNVCALTVWKPKELAKQIVSGPSALKNAKNTAEDSITKEQFTYWLNAKKITYTDDSLQFFYSAVKSPAKNPKMKTEAFIKAFDTVKSHPISLD